MTASMFLPTFLFALGLVTLRSATAIGLAVLALAVVEAAFVSRRDLAAYPKWPKRAWAALWLAAVIIHILALMTGSWPYLPQLSLFVALGVLWWVRIDRDLVEHGIKPVWTSVAVAMLALLPIGILDGARLGTEGDPLSEASPYWNPVLSALGLDARWSGMFAHPNGLGAFSAMGIGLALSGTRISWPLLALSTPLLLASSSRTAGLAALLGALVYAVVRGRLRVRLGVLVAAAVVGLITVQSLARDSNAATGTGRFEIWASVPDLLGVDWLLGVGPDAGPSLVSSGLLPSWAMRLHSVIFEHLLYSGIVGVVCIMVMLALLLVSALNNRDGLALLVVVAILALGDNYGHLFSLTMGVLGYVAVIASCTNTDSARWGRHGMAIPAGGQGSL